MATSAGKATLTARRFPPSARSLLRLKLNFKPFGFPDYYLAGIFKFNLDFPLVIGEVRKNVWDTASWVFGSHFRELMYARDETPKPLQHCYLDGAAQFVRSSIWKKSSLRHACIVPVGWTDPNKVFITQHGFYLVWSDHDPIAMKVFIQRAVEHTGGEATGTELQPTNPQNPI